MTISSINLPQPKKYIFLLIPVKQLQWGINTQVLEDSDKVHHELKLMY